MNALEKQVDVNLINGWATFLQLKGMQHYMCALQVIGFILQDFVTPGSDFGSDLAVA